MLDGEKDRIGNTVVISMRVTKELAQWIRACAGAGNEKHSRAVVIMLETLRYTVDEPQLDRVLRHIRNPKKTARGPSEKGAVATRMVS
ncbi:hypothetical protein [Rubrimonas cliftonensis]|uniref:Uncharacterized protein n=1 Tax=Rubrimonas cliftonensis TaxID=89524 RepID=A0A1H4ESC7_9RHOB|nr:hypothetical protein [Rubrimonas cliftonensis]SEA87931.1 hypothetical protein SAMN05444370_11578 [Rubrimonas cliftonensis]